MQTNPTLELMHLLGWQGGTIHQVCAALHCTIEEILYQGDEKLNELKERAKLFAAIDNK